MGFRRGSVDHGILVGKCWGFSEERGVFGVGNVFNRDALGFGVVGP